MNFLKLNTAFLLFAFVVSPAFAQVAPEFPDSLTVSSASVTIQEVELQTKVQTVRRVVAEYNGKILSAVDSVQSEAVTKSKGVIISADSTISSVVAFDTNFDSASVSQVDDNQYLLVSKPGKYLVIVNTGTGSSVRPVVIKSSGPDTSQLAKLSADLARRVNDPPTQAGLAKALASVGPSVASSRSIDQAETIVQSAVENVLSQRRGESRYKDWLNGWRRPIQEEFNKAGFTTVAGYAAAVDQIGKGLASVGPQSQVPPPVLESPTMIAGPVGDQFISGAPMATPGVLPMSSYFQPDEYVLPPPVQPAF